MYLPGSALLMNRKGRRGVRRTKSPDEHTHLWVNADSGQLNSDVRSGGVDDSIQVHWYVRLVFTRLNGQERGANACQTLRVVDTPHASQAGQTLGVHQPPTTNKSGETTGLESIDCAPPYPTLWQTGRASIPWAAVCRRSVPNGIPGVHHRGERGTTCPLATETGGNVRVWSWRAGTASERRRGRKEHGNERT